MNTYEKLKELLTEMGINFESGLVTNGDKFISIVTAPELIEIYGTRDIISFNFDDDGNYTSLEFDVLDLPI